MKLNDIMDELIGNPFIDIVELITSKRGILFWTRMK